MGFLALRKHNVTLRNVYAKKPESYCAHVLDIFGKRVHVLIRFRWSSVDGQNAAKKRSQNASVDRNMSRFSKKQNTGKRDHITVQEALLSTTTTETSFL